MIKTSRDEDEKQRTVQLKNAKEVRDAAILRAWRMGDTQTSIAKRLGVDAKVVQRVLARVK
jgi:DNA-binding transcriptional regulator LsrR (DeoR family)